MSKKEVISENYLEKIPVKNENIQWKQDENGAVTLEIENTGFFNKIAQKFFKKPKVSYVHLDENGSFLWALSDGEKTITELGVLVKKQFGEKAEPLYERLVKYFAILESYKFIEFRDQELVEIILSFQLVLVLTGK